MPSKEDARDSALVAGGLGLATAGFSNRIPDAMNNVNRRVQTRRYDRWKQQYSAGGVGADGKPVDPKEMPDRIQRNRKDNTYWSMKGKQRTQMPPDYRPPTDYTQHPKKDIPDQGGKRKRRSNWQTVEEPGRSARNRYKQANIDWGKKTTEDRFGVKGISVPKIKRHPQRGLRIAMSTAKNNGMRARVPWIVGPAAVGIPAAWYGAGNIAERHYKRRMEKVRKDDLQFRKDMHVALLEISKQRANQNDGNYSVTPVSGRDVDRFVPGAMIGGAAYHVPSYGIETPIRRKYWAKERQNSAKFRQHRVDSGIEDAKTGKLKPMGDKAWIKFNRTMPKGVPGWRSARVMGYTHAGKTGMAATAGVAGLSGLGAVAWGRKRDREARERR